MAKEKNDLAIELNNFYDIITSIDALLTINKLKSSKHIGAVLNCILSHNAIDTEITINPALKKEHSSIETSLYIDELNKTVNVKVPIIYNKSTLYSDKAFYLFSENRENYTVKYPEWLIHDVQFDNKLSYYAFSSYKDKIDKYSMLSHVRKQEIMKETINGVSEPTTNEMIACFYWSLYKLLQLNPDALYYYILCLELFFLVIEVTTLESTNIQSMDLVEFAKDRTRRSNINVLDDEKVLNIYIAAINELDDNIKAYLRDLLSAPVLD